MKVHRSRVVAATATVAALVATALVIVPAVATPPSPR
jgi:hypothetical protein